MIKATIRNSIFHDITHFGIRISISHILKKVPKILQ